MSAVDEEKIFLSDTISYVVANGNYYDNTGQCVLNNDKRFVLEIVKRLPILAL